MHDPSFETLETSRLTIRRFSDADARPFSAYRSDPEVARYQGWESCSERDAHEFILSLKDLAPGTPGRWFQFAIEIKESGELAGDCALHCPTEDERQGELGFTLARPYQRHGYATEAVGGLLEYAFMRLELHRLHSITNERNYPAHRLLETLGFRIEGRFRENTWFKGDWASERHYAMLCEEWTARDET